MTAQSASLLATLFAACSLTGGLAVDAGMLVGAQLGRGESATQPGATHAARNRVPAPELTD